MKTKENLTSSDKVKRYYSGCGYKTILQSMYIFFTTPECINKNGKNLSQLTNCLWLTFHNARRELEKEATKRPPDNSDGVKRSRSRDVRNCLFKKS